MMSSAARARRTMARIGGLGTPWRLLAAGQSGAKDRQQTRFTLLARAHAHNVGFLEMGGCGGFSSAQIGAAFACTIAAALATVLGSLALVFAPLRSARFVAAALSFSSGVLLFVSLCDIYLGKSVPAFESATGSGAEALLLGTICLFCGIPIASLLDLVSERLMPAGVQDDIPALLAAGNARTQQPARASGAVAAAARCDDLCSICEGSEAGGGAARGGCACSDCELGELGGGAQQAEAAAAAAVAQCGKDAPKGFEEPAAAPPHQEEEQEGEGAAAAPTALPRRRLLKLGLLACLVIAFHNMPEGLVTFLAYLDDIHSGALGYKRRGHSRACTVLRHRPA